MHLNRFFKKSFTPGAGTWVDRSIRNSSDYRNIIKPPRLNRGDTIGFPAPAGIVYEAHHFNRMEQVMDDFGLNVKFGKFVRDRYGYLAGTDQNRIEDLHAFFEDSDIQGIVTVRGGWGSNRILPALNFDLIRENPKFFCGFSDITSLHLAIFRHTGLLTFHGPNGTSDWSHFTRNQFYRIAFGEGEELLLKNPPAETGKIQTISPGRATGKLIGGNLTLVTSLLGSGYIPDLKGHILFLEDIGEQIYKVDRMLSQLHLSGVLNKISGLVFGKCSNCGTGPRGGFSLEEVLGHYLQPLGIPSFSGSMISHDPDIFTVPVGVQAEIDANAGWIRLLENPVA